MFAKTDPHLGSDYGTDEDFNDESSSHDIYSDHDSDSPSDSPRTAPTLTLPTSLSISAPVFSPLVSKAPVFSKRVATENSLTTPQERGPLLSPDDPDTYLGGDSDEELDDYSDDEDDNYSSCFGYNPSFDPGPCSPRPLSQGQPTEEGLCAWLEERGLGVGQPNHYLITEAQITLISEIDIDITPSYPYFTALNLATLGPAPPGAPLPLPLNTTAPHRPLIDYDWDCLGASTCDETAVFFL